MASSTDDGTIWKAAANATITKAFSSTYSAAAGVYFIAGLYHSSAQTTAPTILGGSGLSGGISGFSLTNSNKLNGLIGGQTTLANTTGSALLGTGTNYAIILY